MNVTYAIRALSGMVSNQAHKMFRATLHFTALAPIVDPTPMIDAQITWVVLTGIPTTDAPIIVIALAVSAENP